MVVGLVARVWPSTSWLRRIGVFCVTLNSTTTQGLIQCPWTWPTSSNTLYALGGSACEYLGNHELSILGKFAHWKQAPLALLKTERLRSTLLAWPQRQPFFALGGWVDPRQANIISTRFHWQVEPRVALQPHDFISGVDLLFFDWVALSIISSCQFHSVSKHCSQESTEFRSPFCTPPFPIISYYFSRNYCEVYAYKYGGEIRGERNQRGSPWRARPPLAHL